MDVSFSDEQELLRKSAREFLSEKCPLDLVAEVAGGGGGEKIRLLWQEMAGLGWMGIGFSESHGGLGLSLVDVALLAEELGAALLPAPWFSTVCLAGEAIRIAGTDEQQATWIPEITGGRARATLALLEEAGTFGARGIKALAEAAGDGFRINGVKAFVPDVSQADVVVVAALLEGEPALFLIDAKDAVIHADPGLDLTRPTGRVELDGVVVGADRVLGGAACGWGPIEQALDRATAVASAEACGGAQRMLDRAVEYAKSRHQFQRPIGSFQGVSHRCAEMLLEIEGARSLAYYAAWCCDEDPEAAPIAVSAAKAFAGDAYRSATAQAIQIHGGIGFTWEAGLHHWYRRAFSVATTLGDSHYHRERVVRLLDL